MVSGATKPTLFFGKPYRAGDDPSPGMGTIRGGAKNFFYPGLLNKYINIF
jgi:hypothetical protein